MSQSRPVQIRAEHVTTASTCSDVRMETESQLVAITRICVGLSHVARTNPYILIAFLESFASHIYKPQWETASLTAAGSNAILLYWDEVRSHL